MELPPIPESPHRGSKLPWTCFKELGTYRGIVPQFHSSVAYWWIQKEPQALKSGPHTCHINLSWPGDAGQWASLVPRFKRYAAMTFRENAGASWIGTSLRRCESFEGPSGCSVVQVSKVKELLEGR